VRAISHQTRALRRNTAQGGRGSGIAKIEVSKISDLVQLLKDPKEGLIRRTRKLKKLEYKKAFVGTCGQPSRPDRHDDADSVLMWVCCRVGGGGMDGHTTADQCTEGGRAPWRDAYA
jgi:hypothetical protein